MTKNNQSVGTKKGEGESKDESVKIDKGNFLERAILNFGTFVFLVLVFFLCRIGVTVSGLDQIPYVESYSLYVIFGVIAMWTLYFSAAVVPQNHVWVMELFGRYITTWKSGLKFPFPFFNFINSTEVYIGEQMMPLHMKDAEQRDFGYGDVEFVDISAPVEATLYFKIENPEKAVYNVENLFKALEDKMDSATRGFLGQYTIDGASKIKARTTLSRILDNEYIEPNPDTPPPPLTPKEEKERLKESQLYNEILNNWGVKITGIAISDIVLDDEQKRLRRLVLEASRKEESAKHEKGATITKAKGEKERLLLEGAGIATQVEKLCEMGLSPREASNYLTDRLKWQNVGEKGATVIETSGQGSSVGAGAGFGVGYNTSQEKRESGKKQKEEKGQEQQKQQEETEDIGGEKDEK